MGMALRHRTGQLRHWLEEVERAWLGWSFPPVDRAIADTDWKPDDHSAYCRRCGATVGQGEVTDGGCGSCRGVPVATDGLVRVGSYTGQLRDWILAIKYRQWASKCLPGSRCSRTRVSGAIGRTIAEGM